MKSPNVNTPNAYKRNSLANVGTTPQSLKMQTTSQTPQKPKSPFVSFVKESTPNGNAANTPKQSKFTPKGKQSTPVGTPKQNKRKELAESNGGSAKRTKVEKPSGTAAGASAKTDKPQNRHQRRRAESTRKPRRQFNISLDDPNLKEKVTELINELSSRAEQSKTSIRKLRFLKRTLTSLNEGKGVPGKGAAFANQNKPNPQASKPAQQKKVPQPKPAEKPKQVEPEDDDSEEDEEESDDGDVTLDTSTLTEEAADDSDEDDDDDDDDDEEDEEEPPKASGNKASGPKAQESDDDDDEDEEQEGGSGPAIQNKPGPQKNNNDGKKKRYVLFVANLPWSCTQEEITGHFQKAGEILSVRIPMSQDNRPRGFAYVELKDQDTYEKCLSLDGTFIGGRKIRVQYSEGSNQNSEQRKGKNFKLQAMRARGQLNGSVRQDQKRSFRRGKQQNFNSSQ